MDVVVQPSVSWMSLNDDIKDSGLFFPVDPGPSVRRSHLKDMASFSIDHCIGKNRRHGWNQLQVRTDFLRLFAVLTVG
jgi:FAD/FMN-containing dehydrogenase